MLPTEPIERDPRRRKDNRYGRDEYQAFRVGMRSFIEEYPLYKRMKLDPPPHTKHFAVEVATLLCGYCGGERQFRAPEDQSLQIAFPPSARVEIADKYLEPGVYPIELLCQDCRQVHFYCLICVVVDWDTGEDSSLIKVGQWPMWLPAIPKDIAFELGTDAELYKKALRNMNEGYGIGACAYLRRLVEQYVNPLLQLLYEIKAEGGADEKELLEIKSAIEGKDFSRKTAYAAEIVPKSILVKGTNPLKKLHDLLSESLHVHNEDEAMNIAMQLSKTVEFVIRQLRSHYRDQQEYAATMKELNKPRKTEPATRMDTPSGE